MGQSTPPIEIKSTTKKGQRENNFIIEEDIKLRYHDLDWSKIHNIL